MLKWKRFADAHIKEGEKPVVAVRSGSLVWEEGLINGQWGTLAWNSSAAPMETDYDNPNHPFYAEWKNVFEPQSFILEVEGQALCSHWQYVGAEQTRQGDDLLVRVTLKHALRPIQLDLCTRLDGSPVVERWLEVVNLGGSTTAISRCAPLSGILQALPQPAWWHFFDEHHTGGVWELGWFRSDMWSREGNYGRMMLPDGRYSFDGRFGREYHRHPMCTLENKITGETFLIQLGWSGGYRFSFDYNERDGYDSNLCVTAELHAPAPLRVMATGERWRSPSVHIALAFGGLDTVVNIMNDHVRRMMPHREGKLSLIECGLGGGSDRDMLMEALEEAAQLGVEAYFIDACWYFPSDENWRDGIGQWQVSKERLPNGTREFCDAAHEKGMLFGLWMEAEDVGKRADVLKEHPEWFRKPYGNEPGDNSGLNLANDECAAWVESEIARVIEENQLDLFRLDWTSSNGLQYQENEGFYENTYCRYYDNLYQIYRNLRKRFPNVLFENCAGGGGRTDLGMVPLFDHTWVSDMQVQPQGFRVTNGMTMALPPECVDRLSFGQWAFMTADLGMQLRNQMFGHLTISPTTPAGMKPNEAQRELILHHFRIYKEFVRPFLRESRIFHHTPVLDGAYAQGTGILELTDAGGLRGMVGVFQLAEPKEREVCVRPRGLRAGKTYRVWLDNEQDCFIMRGAELMNGGLTVRLENALTSQLILFEEEKGEFLRKLEEEAE